MSNRQNRQLQADEVALLQSMYPAEFFWIKEVDLEEMSIKAEDCTDLQFGIQLSPLYTLVITLPPTYPSERIPSAYLECGETVRRLEREKYRARLKDEMASLEPGAPLLDLLISAVSSFLLDAVAVREEYSSQLDAEVEAVNPIRKEISRVIIWSHHLLSTQKRKDILFWSKELKLSGFSRPGYPGVIVVEGEKKHVLEFTTRLKSLSWQALQVRDEESSSARLFVDVGKGVVEVETIAEIVGGLKGCQAGPTEGGRLSEWFLQKMKIK